MRKPSRKEVSTAGVLMGILFTVLALGVVFSSGKTERQQQGTSYRSRSLSDTGWIIATGASTCGSVREMVVSEGVSDHDLPLQEIINTASQFPDWEGYSEDKTSRGDVVVLRIGRKRDIFYSNRRMCLS